MAHAVHVSPSSARSSAPRRSIYSALAMISSVCLLTIAATATSATKEPNANTDPKNFEGTWADLPTASPFLLGIDLPYKPETQNIASDHIHWFKSGNAYASAHLTCRPTGVQGITAPKGPVLILQTPDKVVLIAEEDREVRRIYLNAEHPKDLKPSYSGDSVAHWDGNTLVVDVIGYNGLGQLDEVGNPHSKQMHVVQRISKSADGNELTSEFTFTDPLYYKTPFVKVRKWRRIPGVKLLDYDCAENPRADLFEPMTFVKTNASFKPVCVREMDGGIAAENVTCKQPAPEKAPAASAPSK
jgi:hypothetical protein